MSSQLNASDAPVNMRVTAIRYAADDINVYEIRRPDNAALPRVEPGAHIDVHMPSGLMRQYSLVTADGDERAYLIGIKRDRMSRGGSRFMHEQLRVGQMLDIGGPRNNFPLCETASHTVLIAGGIGITPIWCMAQRLMRLNRSFELHYACRERREAAFLDTLTALPQAHLHFDSEERRVLDIAAIVGNAPADAHFYCCGPQPMLAGYEAATASVDSERVHIEYFAPRAAAACEGGFVVQLHRTGQQFEVPQGKTILQVLREAGVSAPYSCEEGICGACQVDVIEGTPDHRDSVLSEREQVAGDVMLICCSGSKSERLVIDF
ncbi:ferredoxin [Caballeronia novacaledonica]|uniref:Ferredoxin n=1 Tax=Caballeronia novacaledonica TaxID=1544861 RepID=A0A2U3I1H5_9BURK|nr:PDR/VanB family oxidoreductase [Caballeronia novacaledonica]SPB13933.1 ferredoxin [Caballeronia novacaledonica]